MAGWATWFSFTLQIAKLLMSLRIWPGREPHYLSSKKYNFQQLFRAFVSRLFFFFFCVLPKCEQPTTKCNYLHTVGGRWAVGGVASGPRHLARRIPNFQHTKLFANILFLRLFPLSIGVVATPTPPDWHWNYMHIYIYIFIYIYVHIIKYMGKGGVEGVGQRGLTEASGNL